MAVFTDLRTAHLSAEPRVLFDSNIFRGASYHFEVLNSEDSLMSTLMSMSGVKNVWPVETVERPQDEIIWEGNDLEFVPDNIKEKVGTSGQGGLSEYTPHVATQVNKLHNEGFTGKGVKVAIIDDGIDYNHTAVLMGPM